MNNAVGSTVFNKKGPQTKFLKLSFILDFKMRLALSVLLVFVTYIAVASSRNPVGVYDFYPYKYNPPYYDGFNADAVHPRQLMWSLSDIITVAFPRPTISATFTTTATMTCTKSVARICRLYQRPFKQRSNPSNNSTGQS